jgi:predicted nucleic acid-binding protein
MAGPQNPKQILVFLEPVTTEVMGCGYCTCASHVPKVGDAKDDTGQKRAGPAPQGAGAKGQGPGADANGLPAGNPGTRGGSAGTEGGLPADPKEHTGRASGTGGCSHPGGEGGEGIEVMVLVVDASALIEFLLRTPRSRTLDALFTDPDVDLHVPALSDLEVVSVLRRVARRDPASVTRAEQALDHYLGLPLTRHGHQGFLHRCFELRNVLTPYDAAYVALAEDLGADLVTADRRLARAAKILGVSCLSA